MAKAKKYIPEGLRSLTTHLVVPNALEAIEFYKKAFGAELESHAPGATPGSTIHAALKIGDAALFLADEMPESKAKSPSKLGGTTTSLMFYVSDVDAVVARAVKNGAMLAMPVSDQFWGDRYGQVIDPFGHLWEIGTHKEDLTEDELRERAMKFAEAR
jgi:PhnB protein